MAMQEFVVPKSMPKIFAIYLLPRRMRADAIEMPQQLHYKVIAILFSSQASLISPKNSA
jgi:hypothetical protein